MIYIKRFLCYDNTKSGSKFCADYYIVLSVLFIAINIFLLRNKEEIVKSYNKEETELNPEQSAHFETFLTSTLQHIFVLGLIAFSLALLVNILLRYGAHTDRRVLFIPWIFWMCADCFLSIVLSLICFYFMAIMVKLIVTFLIILVSAALDLAFKLYMLLCVVSQYHALGEEQQVAVVPLTAVEFDYQSTVIGMQPNTDETKLNAV